MISSWIACTGLIANSHQFLIRNFGVSSSPTHEAISEISAELVRAHSSPQMVRNELKYLCAAADHAQLDIVRDYVENEILPNKERVITRIGNFGEVIAAQLLVELDDFWFPIYKLRFREKKDWAIRLTDLFLIRRAGSSGPTVCFGEVKTKSSTCDKDIGKKGHDSLAKDDALDSSPEILHFVCRMLYEAGRHDEADLISKIRLGIASYSRRHELFILHEEKTWDDEIIERLDSHTIDPRLVNFTVNIIRISQLRDLIDTCYEHAWANIQEILDE